MSETEPLDEPSRHSAIGRVASLIRDYLATTGLTQKALALAAGVDAAAITNVLKLRNLPSSETCRKLEIAMNAPGQLLEAAGHSVVAPAAVPDLANMHPRLVGYLLQIAALEPGEQEVFIRTIGNLLELSGQNQMSQNGTNRTFTRPDFASQRGQDKKID